MKNNAKFVLIVLICMSILMGSYEVFLYIKEIETSQNLIFIWAIEFTVLLALWVSEDSKEHPDIYRPYEYGYLIFIFYIPYIPYYLVKTRGLLIGMGFILSFIILFNAGIIIQWLLYLAS